MFDTKEAWVTAADLARPRRAVTPAPPRACLLNLLSIDCLEHAKRGGGLPPPAMRARWTDRIITRKLGELRDRGYLVGPQLSLTAKGRAALAAVYDAGKEPVTWR